MKQLDCILLIDDDKTTYFLNRRLLRKMGAAQTINIAQNGVEGIEYIEESINGNSDFPHPNLIFLDINMPLVNGWEFLEKYSKFSGDYKKSIIIIMLSTSLRESDRDRVGHFNEVKGLISKPLSEEQVKGLIEKYFN